MIAPLAVRTNPLAACRKAVGRKQKGGGGVLIKAVESSSEIEIDVDGKHGILWWEKNQYHVNHTEKRQQKPQRTGKLGGGVAIVILVACRHPGGPGRPDRGLAPGHQLAAAVLASGASGAGIVVHRLLFPLVCGEWPPIGLCWLLLMVAAGVVKVGRRIHRSSCSGGSKQIVGPPAPKAAETPARLARAAQASSHGRFPAL